MPFEVNGLPSISLISSRSIAHLVVFGLIALLLHRLYLHPRKSSFANIAGPAIKDALTGNIRSIFSDCPEEWHHNQTRQFGSTYRIRGFGGADQLYISDPDTLKHVLSKNSYSYTKPQQLGPFKAVFGEGILFSEGKTHARQRRIMQSAFQQKAVDGYKAIFEQVTQELCDKLSSLCESQQDGTEAVAVVDMLDWTSRATLRIIGLAGFDYPLDSLNSEQSPLVKAMDLLTAPTPSIILMQLASHYLPVSQRLPIAAAKTVKQCRDIISHESQLIIQRRVQMDQDGGLEEKCDLMSLLYKANKETTNQRDMMSETEMSGQVATFLLAGNETSSTSLSWMIARLIEHPEVQERLQAEITHVSDHAASAGRNVLSNEEISRMTYLEGFIRETLRLTKALSRTIRVAEEDDILPLSSPIRTVGGTTISCVPIKKGERVQLGIPTFNVSTEIYGDDAEEFKPERWSDDGLASKSPLYRSFASWAPQLSFLGGPRGCPGIRFAILELKVLLIGLLRNFTFERREIGIRFRPNLVARPLVVGEDKKGPQLPVCLRSRTGGK